MNDVIYLDEEDKIYAEIEENDRVILKMKYGVIRIAGENHTREVTWNTYNYLKSLPADFTGLVEIKELKLTVPANQIVKLEEKESESVRYKDFTKLPTETIVLDENFELLNGSRLRIEREHDKYYRATCHYVVRDGVKQYYLEPHQIKDLLTMVRDEDPDYPHRVQKALRYGRDIWEIHKEQEENRKRR